jgi:hypothetical protein
LTDSNKIMADSTIHHSATPKTVMCTNKYFPPGLCIALAAGDRTLQVLSLKFYRYRVVNLLLVLAAYFMRYIIAILKVLINCLLVF